MPSWRTLRRLRGRGRNPRRRRVPPPVFEEVQPENADNMDNADQVELAAQEPENADNMDNAEIEAQEPENMDNADEDESEPEDAGDMENGNGNEEDESEPEDAEEMQNVGRQNPIRRPVAEHVLPEPEDAENMENGDQEDEPEPEDAEGGDQEHPAAAENENVQGGLQQDVGPAEPVVAIPRVGRRAPRVRNFQRRPVYTQAQKEHAVRLLNAGVPCRQVARQLGPRCSSGTPIRWRQQMRAAEVGRLLLQNQIRRAMMVQENRAAAGGAMMGRANAPGQNQGQEP